MGEATLTLAPSILAADFARSGEQVMIMAVSPGFGHQRFLPTTLPKIRRVRQMIETIGSGCDVELDRSIEADTAPLAVAAGASVLVVGTSIPHEGEAVAVAMEQLPASAQQWWEQPHPVG